MYSRPAPARGASCASISPAPCHPSNSIEKKSMMAINFSPNYDSLRIEFIAKISYLSESAIAAADERSKRRSSLP